MPTHAAEVRSPDDRIAFAVELDADGRVSYHVSFDDEKLIAASRLGLRFKDHVSIESSLKTVGTEHRSSDSVWEQPWGERRLIRDHYNELLVEFESVEGPERRFALRARVHNDGLGFRYEVPEQANYRGVDIVDELTEFRVQVDAVAYWIPGRGWNRYEYLYRTTPVEDLSLAHTPVTMRTQSGTHISIHEAALVDYAAYTLDQRRPGVLQTNLAPRSDGVRVKTKTPFITPWRTIQISPNAVGLLNSSLILNLNDPNVLGDVSWVEPGKYIGIWWAMHIGKRTWGSGEKHGATTAEAKRYIDFAAEHGFDGVLVESWNTGWDGDWFNNGAIFSFTEPYPDFDLQAVANYAREKGVRLIGHHETSGHISNYEAQMADAYDLYESLGVRQIKTGYVADGGQMQRVDAQGVMHYEWHDSQIGVNHYQHVLEEAAKRKISINTHEPVKDTGLRRTYPNWVSREGARGQEYNANWALPNPPEHNVLLAYTRLLGGPMDFTPGIFDLTHQGPGSEFRVQSTLMHQLALYVVLYSPIQMAADLPENYAKHREAFQFIVDVPTDWEKSAAVAGEVGDYVVFARKERGGEDWYLGAISDEESRSLSVPLSFLDASSTYIATIYRDGDDADWGANPYDYVIETREFDRNQTLELKLAAGGGTAIRFRPRPEAGQ
ncbi:MAG: glycoside hydrolase family 97 protein [Gammaproteobacteria bacterium]|nr:glycoside hydrolase family 97 protein [Gammaproteobacteria bacterium]MDH3409651.1 glycoside hydrolase family 97 protein [Gammaproteobacteria bacterium]MDH3552542.1 glycoside hydrolase family 97 protein [Gammaproteobacteria bacterium]